MSALPLDTQVRCTHCGCRGNAHRASDGLCPATEAFPRFPTTIRDEAKAESVWDARIASHWSARTTTFNPRSI